MATKQITCPSSALQQRGERNYLAGQAAEDQVAQAYERCGHRIVSRRWRGPLGEIDIIAERGGEIIFVEVKAASSFARAAQALTRRQIDRLLRSAEHYIGTLPRGLATPMRFDVALVDRTGQMDILRNALTT